jgi:DNA polymerase-3 subunit gamma/tau
MAQSPPASDPAAGTDPAPGPHAGTAGYQVVARRYRPQRFDELVGQEHVARGLSGAIESGRIGHAYLFTGARGVGKTSAARIYAKALECTGGKGAEPCNTCERCRAISSGQDIDVVEVDAASNRGIDEIRQLRQNVAVRPARGRSKIYIIDEVHMLTREAFNALLKTLEEPPAHVKFVLCTTEPEKLPITILSRCQRFDFQTVDAPAIARRLEQIVAAEGASVSPEALSLIARRAAGSMRDSQSLLEQLLGAASGPIGIDDVHAVIGTGREEKVGAVVAAIAARDARAAIAAFDESLAGGADPGGVLEQVLAALRDALLASVGCGPEQMRQGEGLGVDLAAFGREAGTATLLAMLQIIDHALGRMRSSGHAAVLAEMAVVRLASLEDLDGLAEAVERVASAAAASPVAAARPAPQARPRDAASGAAPAEATPREKKTTDLVTAEADGPREPAVRAGAAPSAADAAAVGIDAIASPSAAVVPQLPADSMELWHRASETVGGLAADFAALAGRAAWREEVLEITLPTTAANAASFLRRPEVAAAVARALAEIAGRPVRHALVVEEPEAAGGPQSVARGATHADRGRQPASQAALLREALEHPLVIHARTVFDAAVRKVEPARPRQATSPQVVATAPRAAAGGEDERDHPVDDERFDGDVGRGGDEAADDGGDDG